MTDIIKIIIAIAILASGIVGFYWFPQQSELLRTIGVIASVIIAAVVFGQTKKGKIIFEFISAAKQEARKIVWPSKKETNQTTLIVVVAVLILGLILWMVDSLLSTALQWLIG